MARAAVRFQWTDLSDISRMLQDAENALPEQRAKLAVGSALDKSSAAFADIVSVLTRDKVELTDKFPDLLHAHVVQLVRLMYAMGWQEESVQGLLSHTREDQYRVMRELFPPDPPE